MIILTEGQHKGNTKKYNFRYPYDIFVDKKIILGRSHTQIFALLQRYPCFILRMNFLLLDQFWKMRVFWIPGIKANFMKPKKGKN